VLEATLALKAGNTAVIQDEMRRMSAERASKQDIGTQSCGCIFKNPAWPRTPVSREKLLTDFPELAAYANRPEIPAAFLIDRAGMKGKREGRIAVSPKHANFFINEGGGTAAQVRSLIATAQGAVREKYGIELREEIQYLGF
jgi:UDP-N-acetylmuramate dehydrogenase